MNKKALSFQGIISKLQQFWGEQGCLVWMPYHESVGAGTMNPATVLRVLGPEPWNVAYVEPSFRADDGRFGENPNRVQMHHQFQVILQPGPSDPTGVYLKSLEALGLDLSKHDVRFVEDNWESPALGAWGLGWEVWLDGMEITQFTYFQQSGGVVLDPPAVEITYGLERIAMYLQDVDSIWNIRWDEQQSYGDILKLQEIEYCEYNFNVADIDRLKLLYSTYMTEGRNCIEKDLVIPAHDYVLKCSHTFNLLDARGAVGLAERVKYFGEMRSLARKVSEGFLKQRENAGFPLMTYMPKVTLDPLSSISKIDGAARSFILEVGVEELAAESIPTLIQQLKDSIGKLLSESKLSYDECFIDATPRRLVCYIKNLQARQSDSDVEVWGPRRDVCEKNQQALLGFCKKNGVDVSNVSYAEKDGVEFAKVTRHEIGRSAPEILAEKLPTLIPALRAEKNMRWLASSQYGDVANLAFNRPIRWIVALYGDDIVPFYCAGVKSGRMSRSGRWLGSADLLINSAEHYSKTISQSGVILDTTERKTKVKESVIKAAQEYGGKAVIRESVLEEVAYLVEMPTVIIGSFDSSYRKLPRVVLAGTMEKHLRFFPIEDKDGTIVAFAAVRNGAEDPDGIVRRGYERVIGARFSDAAFFVSRDEQHKLVDFRERIRTLTFVEGMGSMFDKTERLRTLLPKLAPKLGFKTKPELLDRVAQLSKADLGSQMVVEMSSLQGKMGRIYAECAGEDSSVSLALEEQYLPGFSGDRLPESELGKILAFGDRIDTVAALFAKGAEPTGSADPFGIRREALAILAIVLGDKISTSLKDCFSTALAILGFENSSEIVERIMNFMSKRLEVIFREKGFQYDVVRAVLARQTDDPALAEVLITELNEIASKQDLSEGLVAYLRCARIVDHAQSQKIKIPEFDLRVFKFNGGDTSASEVALLDTFKREFDSVNGSASILDRVKRMARMAPAIHAFFENVMVMGGEEAQRDQRLSVLSGIVSRLDSLADLRILERSGDS